MQPDLVRVDPGGPSFRRRSPRRRRTWLLLFLAVILAAGALAAGAIAVNAFGVGTLYQRLESKIDRWLAGPPPDRATLPTVEVTDPPETPSPSSAAAASDPLSASGISSPRVASSARALAACTMLSGVRKNMPTANTITAPTMAYQVQTIVGIQFGPTKSVRLSYIGDWRHDHGGRSFLRNLDESRKVVREPVVPTDD